MASRTELITEALKDFLAYARGCHHEDHSEEDEKKCRAVAHQISEAIRNSIDSHENDTDYHPVR